TCSVLPRFSTQVNYLFAEESLRSLVAPCLGRTISVFHPVRVARGERLAVKGRNDYGQSSSRLRPSQGRSQETPHARQNSPPEIVDRGDLPTAKPPKQQAVSATRRGLEWVCWRCWNWHGGAKVAMHN